MRTQSILTLKVEFRKHNRARVTPDIFKRLTSLCCVFDIPGFIGCLCNEAIRAAIPQTGDRFVLVLELVVPRGEHLDIDNDRYVLERFNPEHLGNFASLEIKEERHSCEGVCTTVPQHKNLGHIYTLFCHNT